MLALAAASAASLVVVVHLAFLAYLVVGGFLALRRFSLLWPSVVATSYAVWVTLADRACPLTTLEKWLWEAAGRESYEGSFISYYLQDVLYPAEYEMVVFLLSLGIVLWSYALVLTRRRTARRALAAALPSTPAPAA